MMRHRQREALVLLTESAAAVALSVLLGNLRLVELPNGGSIALATLPLLALALARGVRVGTFAGCCAGIAHALAGGTIVHPIQLLLDYPVAYAALGLAGIAAGRGSSRATIAAALVVAMLAHLAAMVVSGVVFFATVAGDAALAYSLAYNAATVGPELLLAIWLVPALLRSIGRANPADAWRRGLLVPPPGRARVVRRHVPVAASVVASSMRPAPAPAPASAPGSAPPAHAPGTFVRPAPFSARRRLG